MGKKKTKKSTSLALEVGKSYSNHFGRVVKIQAFVNGYFHGDDHLKYTFSGDCPCKGRNWNLVEEKEA